MNDPPTCLQKMNNNYKEAVTQKISTYFFQNDFHMKCNSVNGTFYNVNEGRKVHVNIFF